MLTSMLHSWIEFAENIVNMHFNKIHFVKRQTLNVLLIVAIPIVRILIVRVYADNTEVTFLT
jgi:hypothetical protein